MKVHKFDTKLAHEVKKMAKSDFVNLFSLNIRDLRPVFSHLQVATILPRHDAIIINLGFAKAILSVNELYLIDQEHSTRLKNFINELLSKKEQIIDQKVFLLAILDAIFNAKVRQMNEKVGKIVQQVESILPALRKDLSDANLAYLLSIKKRISKMETRLAEIHSAAKDILEDDDDFAEMLLTAKSTQTSHDELESIFEDFIERIEDNIGHVFRLKEEVEDTEDFINLQLSSRRTKIVKFDLIATMITLPLTFLAVVVGLYGVNIKNGFEESHTAFNILTISIILFFAIMTIILMKILKKNNLL